METIQPQTNLNHNRYTGKSQFALKMKRECYYLDSNNYKTFP